MHKLPELLMKKIPKTVRSSGPNVDASPRGAKLARRASTSLQGKPTGALIGLTASLALMAPLPAHAVDGCLVLLCLAAPSWRAIPQCVPPIRQLFRDLARGKAFPTCAMGGSGNASSHAWSNAPTYCPPQYTRVQQRPNGPVYICDYVGAISVSVQGAPFATTWWSLSGDAVTDFSPAAKAQLGRWDTRFDDDLAAWIANPPVQPVP